MSLFKKLLVILYFPYNVAIVYLRNVSIETSINNIRGPIFIRGKGHLSIGKNTKINSHQSFNPIGGELYTSFSIEPNAKIVIGKNVGISNATFYSKLSINIGDNVKIGGGVKIYDTDFHSINYKLRRDIESDVPNSAPIFIDSDSFIGSHSIILKGVSIGKGAIIGAGSIVTKDVPPLEIWAGNPAKKIKSLQ